MKRSKYKGKYRKYIYITQDHEYKEMQKIFNIYNNVILKKMPGLTKFINGNLSGIQSLGISVRFANRGHSY